MALQKKHRHYVVGYGKPPTHTQFRKGNSGNRQGKQKGDENTLTAFRRLASRYVPISEGGNQRSMPLWLAIIYRNYLLATQRGGLALSNFHALLESCGELVDRKDPEVVGMPILVPPRLSIEEWTEKFAPDQLDQLRKQERENKT